jgi:AcrR family transcriptional regulator
MSIAKLAQIRELPRRGPGRPRNQAKDEAILTAAQTLFLERGFEGVSVDAIAEAAGVAKATVYARFPDKESLLRTAITSKCTAFLGAAQDEIAPEGDFRAGLIEFSRRFLALVCDQEALSMLRLMMKEAQSSPALPTLFFECAIQPTCNRLAAFIAASADPNNLAVADPKAAAWRFLGMVKGEDHLRAMLGLAPRPEAMIERHISECVDNFVAAHRTSGQRR